MSVPLPNRLTPANVLAAVKYNIHGREILLLGEDHRRPIDMRVIASYIASQQKKSEVLVEHPIGSDCADRLSTRYALRAGLPCIPVNIRQVKLPNGSPLIAPPLSTIPGSKFDVTPADYIRHLEQLQKDIGIDDNWIDSAEQVLPAMSLAETFYLITGFKIGQTRPLETLANLYSEVRESSAVKGYTSIKVFQVCTKETLALRRKLIQDLYKKLDPDAQSRIVTTIEGWLMKRFTAERFWKINAQGSSAWYKRLEVEDSTMDLYAVLYMLISNSQLVLYPQGVVHLPQIAYLIDNIADTTPTAKMSDFSDFFGPTPFGNYVAATSLGPGARELIKYFKSVDRPGGSSGWLSGDNVQVCCWLLAQEHLDYARWKEIRKAWESLDESTRKLFVVAATFAIRQQRGNLVTAERITRLNE